MAEHQELLAEMAALSRLSAPERLRHAQKRRAQQLKRWAQAEREAPATPNAAAERRRRRTRRKRVTFPASVRLLEAAGRHDVEEVRQFLESGMSPDLCNEDGLTALHQLHPLSCIDGSLALARLLLEAGAAVDARDAELWTPLHAAATCGHLRLAQLLLQRGADLLALNSDGDMPYDLCEDEATLECLESAMAQRGITQERIEEARAATERAMLREIRQLLRHGAPLDTPRGHCGATLLHVAAAHGFRAAAELLLRHRARADARDADGWQPLHAAACWGQVALAELLVAHGADLGARSLQDETPLDVCGDEEARARLLELQQRRAAALRARHGRERLQRRASGAGSRGRVVRRCSLSERSSRYRRQLQREAIEAIVWGQRGDTADTADTGDTEGTGDTATDTAEGTDIEGTEGTATNTEGTGTDAEDTATTEGTATEALPPAGHRGAGEPPSPLSPEPNGSPLSPLSSLSPRCPPAPSGDKSHPHTLAHLKRHRAAAKNPKNRPKNHPENTLGDTGDTPGDTGDTFGDTPGDLGDTGDIGDTLGDTPGDTPRLRLTAPPPEAPAEKQRCCRVM